MLDMNGYCKCDAEYLYAKHVFKEYVEPKNFSTILLTVMVKKYP